MSLLAIKAYLIEKKLATFAHLKAQFSELSPVLLQDMLAYWVSKGRVRCFTKTPFCGGQCSKCDVATTAIYEWVAL